MNLGSNCWLRSFGASPYLVRLFFDSISVANRDYEKVLGIGGYLSSSVRFSI